MPEWVDPLTASRRRIETTMRRICYALALITLPPLGYRIGEGDASCLDDEPDCYVDVVGGLIWGTVTLIAVATIITVIAIRVDLKRRFGPRAR